MIYCGRKFAAYYALNNFVIRILVLGQNISNIIDFILNSQLFFSRQFSNLLSINSFASIFEVHCKYIASVLQVHCKYIASILLLYCKYIALPISCFVAYNAFYFPAMYHYRDYVIFQFSPMVLHDIILIGVYS